MALLDAFTGLTNLTPDQNQGLLAAAAAVLQGAGDPRRPFGFGQALGTGIQAFQQGLQGAEDRKYQQQLRGLQLEEANMTAEERKRKRQLEQQIQDAALASVRNPAQMALAGGGGPTQANADAMQGMQPGFDEQAFINRVQAIDPLRAQEFARQFAKAAPEFDTKINYVNGPDGKPVAVIVNKAGQVKTLEGLAPREKKEFLNLGGREIAVNPYDIQPNQSFQRTMTPGEAASNAVARANLGLASQRLDLDRQGLALRAQNEKAPTEFQGKSAAFGLRAGEADKVLRDLQGKYSPAAINSKLAVQEAPLIGGALGAATNLALSPSDQQAEQAQRDFVNAVLRQESGAAIGMQEFDNARRQYFPQPGDSKEVITQKARNRELAIQGLNNNAGRARMTAPSNSGWGIERVD
jgi:Sec-independent protein translocase protein TatA